MRQSPTWHPSRIGLRDPVWTFVGVMVAVVGVVVTLAVCIGPKIFEAVVRMTDPSASKPTLPKTYSAGAPGPGCDNGKARWTLKEGKVTCTGQRAVYEDAIVWFDWPGRAFAPAYEISLYADDLGPTTCVLMLARDKYSVAICASGGVSIYRLDPQVTRIAGEPTRTFTRAEIMIRVEEQSSH